MPDVPPGNNADCQRHSLSTSSAALWLVKASCITCTKPSTERSALGASASASRCAADEAARTAADEAAREILRRQFLLPLVAAGHEDIKVKVTLAAPPPPSTPDSDAKD
jgi:hypothetical protein